jgi:tripartite-type tricarboxylate transporter receptor subunit TctC
MAKVPYKNTVEALNDLSEGRIDIFIGAYAIVRAQAQNGKVKVLALLNHERAPNLNIPTVAEAGEPDLGFDGLVGLFGPPSMPLDLRERIAADVKVVAQDPEVIAKLTATGQIIVPGGAAEFTKATGEQRAQVEAVGKTLGIKPSK